LPLGQASHPVASDKPVVDEYVPFAHKEQLDAPSDAANDPAPHEGQLDAPLDEYFPGEPE
jgi:hypothetical protein